MFTHATVRAVMKKLGFRDMSSLPFPIETILSGMNVELEHGSKNAFTNITNDDPVMTAKIALAHLFEDPNYYVKLWRAGL